jgi:putative membrane protein
VKKFAEHMVEDHAKMLQEHQTLAKSKGVALPKQPKKEHQAALKKLEALRAPSSTAPTCSRWWKTTKNLEASKDPDLKKAAEKAVAEVQKHLDMAKEIAEKKTK